MSEGMNHTFRQAPQLQQWTDLGFSRTDAILIVADERRRQIRRAKAAGVSTAEIAKSLKLSAVRTNQLSRGRSGWNPVAKYCAVSAAACLTPRNRRLLWKTLWRSPW